jgi:hypothetical protein
LGEATSSGNSSSFKSNRWMTLEKCEI